MLVQVLRALGDPLRRYWRGGYGVLASIFIFLLGLRLALYVGQAHIFYDLSFVFIILWCGLNATLWFWQVVGGKRAIDRHLRASGDTISAWGGYLALLIVSVMTAVQIVDAVTPRVPPQIHLALPDPEPLPVSADGTTLTLSGDLSFQLNDRFIATLRAYPSVNRVVLDSEGGLIHAARAVARHVVENHLSTHVEVRCYSACARVFIAGKHRTVAPGGRIGFHRYQIHSAYPLTRAQLSEEQRKDRDYFRRQGVSADFLERAFTTHHEDIWIPSLNLLASSGLLTQ